MDFRNEIDEVGSLGRKELIDLLENFTDEDLAYASEKAGETARRVFGNGIYIRGLIEFTNYCKNNCLYCGIRAANPNAVRYRLGKEEILACCKSGYASGFRTFVLQGGEDPYYTDDRLCDIISSVREAYPDCAVTLSVGEKSRSSYGEYFRAGANRYLLRHETADPCHYAKLHPENMSYGNRMRCLRDLKEIGYQTGCGMMVGSPFQTAGNLADDILFMREFQPEMIGIGPFIPQKDTPFGKEKAGSVRMTLMLLSLMRLHFPDVLLPATTALNTASRDGRLEGIRCGANVIMPNLSPAEDREKYLLYDNKVGLYEDAAEQLDIIGKQLGEAGYRILYTRGDYADKALQAFPGGIRPQAGTQSLNPSVNKFPVVPEWRVK